jgi:hypothetical protein
VEDIRQFVLAVASTALPAELDDGLTFDLDNVSSAQERSCGEGSKPGPL